MLWLKLEIFEYLRLLLIPFSNGTDGHKRADIRMIR